MKTVTMPVELTHEELAALNARAEREQRLPYQTASVILSRALRRDLRNKKDDRRVPA
jgi:hypothetical protein